MAGHNEQPAVAIVDASAEGVAIWHVNIGSSDDVSRSRLTGAWLLPESQFSKIGNLIDAKYWLPTLKGAKALADLGIVSARGVISASATVDMARKERIRLLTAFDLEQARREKAKRLVDLALPEIVDAQEPWDPAEYAPPGVAIALTVARWLDKLARTWTEMESERLARPFLRGLGGTQPRPLRVILT